MLIPTVYVNVPRNLALSALAGHVGGAVLFGFAGLAWGAYFAQWTVFLGASFAGAVAAAIGTSLMRVDEMDLRDIAHTPPARPWAAIALGTLVSILVTSASFAISTRISGIFEGSPCFGDRVDTMMPLQYTCLNASGPVALVRPELIALTLLAFAGAAAIIWGQVALLRAHTATDGLRADPLGRILGWGVAGFLALDGTLGVAVLRCCSEAS
jgi:hypothetical protein